ncbi:hypothetical protein Blastoid_2 [Bacillus phage Blastoid]|uniref:Uncharacterized protein n=1 Tax=Bacillus phage Blastoid TaxID=2880540 RepID=U5PSS5_9CAUD|nr:hypothetical protein V456_gp02 [Bacillus phage Blastoid]AGY46801.1 hypothetical protein Blastoid_2 [Bacillus phage Blastoid]
MDFPSEVHPPSPTTLPFFFTNKFYYKGNFQGSPLKFNTVVQTKQAGIISNEGKIKEPPRGRQAQ